MDRMRKRAAKVIRNYFLGDEANRDDLLNISVTYDGSWAKRGYSSNIGIGFIVEVETGIILDFEVLWKYCHTCTQIENIEKNGNITAEDLERRKREHKNECQINMDPKRSSGSMEGEIAKILMAASSEQRIH